MFDVPILRVVPTSLLRFLKQVSHVVNPDGRHFGLGRVLGEHLLPTVVPLRVAFPVERVEPF